MTNAEDTRNSSDAELLGQVLDRRFLIEKKLGEGGMSEVYLATNLNINKPVAIKTIRVDLCLDAVYLERFTREVSSLCKLSHPNIVSVHDYFIDTNGQPFVIMDYLQGISLEDLITKESNLSIQKVLNIGMQIISALGHAHGKGIVHRDLKPANVIIVENSERELVKVVDFGLAKLAESNVKLTKSGELLGSPPYMSPEQCLGKSGDERSDIYSLGALLYEALTGKDPFYDYRTVYEMIEAHISIKPPSFIEANPNILIPTYIETAIMKALEKDPNARFQTPAELGSALMNAEDKTSLVKGSEASTPATSEKVFAMALNPLSNSMLREYFPEASNSVEEVKVGNKTKTKSRIETAVPNRTDKNQPQTAHFVLVAALLVAIVFLLYYMFATPQTSNQAKEPTKTKATNTTSKEKEVNTTNEAEPTVNNLSKSSKTAGRLPYEKPREKVNKAKSSKTALGSRLQEVKVKPKAKTQDPWQKLDNFRQD